jgi:hypothetical protein
VVSILTAGARAKSTQGPAHIGKGVGDSLGRIDIFYSPFDVGTSREVKALQCAQSRSEGCGTFPERIICGVSAAAFVLQVNAHYAVEVLLNESDGIVARRIKMPDIKSCTNPLRTSLEYLDVVLGRPDFAGVGRIINLIVQAHVHLMFFACPVNSGNQGFAKVSA